MFIKHMFRLFLLVLFIGSGTFTAVLQEDSASEDVLRPDATLDEIVTALENAHKQFDTLYVQVTSYDHHSQSSVTAEVWFSAIQGAFHWQTTTVSPDGEVFEILEISDGEYYYTSNGFDGQPMVTLMMMYDPTAVAKGLTVLAPEAIARRLAEPIDRNPQVEIVGVETVEVASVDAVAFAGAGVAESVSVETIEPRETIKVIYTSELTTMNLWVDMASGILLRYESWSPEGELVSTDTVDAIVFNPVIPNPETLFYVDHSAYDPESISNFFNVPVPIPAEGR